MKKEKRIVLSLYQRFAALMILVGVLPMLILSTFISNRMVENYRAAIESEYRQATGYIASNLQSLLGSYNTALKLPYYYDLPEGRVSELLAFDNFRQLLDKEPGALNESMTAFLRYVANVDPNIYAVHFVGKNSAGEQLDFHYSNYSSYFRGNALFLVQVGHSRLDESSNALLLIPPHSFDYYGRGSEKVITLARNYFDLRGEVGSRSYVGTLFIDIPLQRLTSLVRTADLSQNSRIYIVGENGDCFYSPNPEQIGQNINDYLEQNRDEKNKIVITSSASPYGIGVVVAQDTSVAFGQIRILQRMMVLILLGTCALILLGSVYFSHRLVGPIHEMIGQMEAIERGNFDIQLEVRSEDEIGILSRRFNQMSRELKNYINQSYLARIKQTEAELTALRSQIYPHFLYNTLEVIRMTAQEEGNAAVPDMIEALSEQIHYLIGPAGDMVPLEKEFDIVRKYIYLLNCRVRQKIQLALGDAPRPGIIVPRLVLQPIVENAYVHGVKGKSGGTILIEAGIERDILEITVMDNGAGMDAETLKTLRALLEGDELGIRNRDDWQSIGLKNVHDRLRFLFGEDYGVDITSTPGVGTMVRLTMPCRYGEEEPHADDTGR